MIIFKGVSDFPFQNILCRRNHQNNYNFYLKLSKSTPMFGKILQEMTMLGGTPLIVYSNGYLHFTRMTHGTSAEIQMSEIFSHINMQN